MGSLNDSYARAKQEARGQQLKTELWSSPTTFLFATIGCSVGLGNLWRFPYVAGENGGGAFVLVYIGFVLLIGIPLIMAELAIARRGRSNPINTTATISMEESGHSRWRLIGLLSIAAPLIALSFYGVVAGWALEYLLRFATLLTSAVACSGLSKA